MTKQIEDLCPRLTIEEIQQLILARWFHDSASLTTTINYTFDLSDVPKSFNDVVSANSNGNSVMKSLTDANTIVVNNMLEKWQQACGQYIFFNYVPKLNSKQPGITFAACDNLVDSNGFTNYTPDVSPYTNELLFNKVLVCLPSRMSTPYNIRTVSHEIGHAIGIGHLHDVESITQNLRETEQGLGCSVMGYNHLLFKSNDNRCSSETYCLNQPYSLYPGPIDKNICTRLYEKHFLPVPQYYRTLLYSFLNGTFEKALSSLLANIEVQDKTIISQDMAKNISVVALSLVNSQMQLANPYLANTLALFELQARINKDHSLNMIIFVRTIANIFSMFMSLYQLYYNDDALTNSIYLAIFLGGSLCGNLLGESIGKQAASLTNTVIKNASSLFSYSANVATSVLPHVSKKIASFGNWLFFDSGMEKTDFVQEVYGISKTGI